MKAKVNKKTIGNALKDAWTLYLTKCSECEEKMRKMPKDELIQIIKLLKQQ